MADEKPAKDEETKRKRRARRSSREVHESILAAASEEFEQNGYAGATTSSIARKANVSEPLIFSNFGSKAELFHASIFEPLNRHLLEFTTSHPVTADGGGQDRDQLRRAYVSELEAFIAQHSRKLLSLFFMQTYGGDTHSLADVEGIQGYLDKASAIASNKPGNERIKPDVLARISFISIFSCIIFKDWLFKGREIEPDELFTSLTDFVIDGLNANER